MHELTKNNVERITNDVRKQEIIFSHLAEDLIDHICCDVEEEMENGLTFNEAYTRVKQKFGWRRLKEIQEETLYAIDTNYKFMKNTMKISGVIGTILYGFAALFKIQHWAGASIMLTLGALILVFAFMPSALGVMWKETHNRNKLVLFISAFLSAGLFITGVLFKIQHWNGSRIILVLAGIIVVLLFLPSLLAAGLKQTENKSKKAVYILGAAGVMTFFTGFIFKIMHWPGSGIFLTGGLIIIFFIALPFYTWLTWSDEKLIKPEFIFLIAGSLSIILPATLLNLNLQRSFDQGFINNLDEQRALYNQMLQNKSQYLASYNDSSSFQSMLQLDMRTNGLLIVITSMEDKIADNPPVSGMVLSDELGNAMSDYRSYLSSVIPQDSYDNISNLLDVSGYLPVRESVNPGIPVMPGLHSLAVLKNGVLTAEIFSLRKLAEIK
ncbi:MAG: hypothetical protein HPY62_09370 [Bacteroidales bacterium]|nr:hypothetical protein [Bacteroidales bacterium]